jgi:nucleotide-binding universal stress UspA family protein
LAHGGGVESDAKDLLCQDGGAMLEAGRAKKARESERPKPRQGVAMFRRIVLAVDLADETPAPKGLTQALELAQFAEGELRLVNVQPLLPSTFMEYVPADFDAAQEAHAREALERIAAKIDQPKVRISTAVASGGVYHELLREAMEWKADLIVVGSHRPAMSDYLIGSNARTIVRHAQCSVLVVRE